MGNGNGGYGVPRLPHVPVPGVARTQPCVGVHCSGPSTGCITGHLLGRLRNARGGPSTISNPDGGSSNKSSPDTTPQPWQARQLALLILA